MNHKTATNSTFALNGVPRPAYSLMVDENFGARLKIIGQNTTKI